MHKLKNVLRNVVILLSVCGLLFVAPAKPAYAQCTSPAGGISTAIGAVWSMLQAEISAAQVAIQGVFQAMISALQSAVMSIISDVTGNAKDFVDQLWENDMDPAHKDMTAQLHTAQTDASRAELSSLDAAELTRTLRFKKIKEIEGRRIFRPSELRCQGQTFLSGMLQMEALQEAYARAAPIEHASVTAASVGTPAADGYEAYQKSRWDDYCNRYVDPQSNQGNTGCPIAPIPPQIGEAVNANNLFEDGYDITDAQERRNVDDLAQNICGVETIARIQINEFGSAKGRAAFMKGLTHMSRQQLCYTGMYHSLSKNVQIGNGSMNPVVAAHAVKGGLNPLTIPANPSVSTMSNVLEASMAVDLQSQLAADSGQGQVATMDTYIDTLSVPNVSDSMDMIGAMMGIISLSELEGMVTNSSVSSAVPAP